ncbi:endolytic transglycosylase MltG [Pseudooceanicola sp.]|uniref:endolytic transglycosylase MltG n=1 Tax=Pseudooceanicola sp. TaxID=1914328 RepID=UPI002621C455|nr:endolytic transglycosylase MltG [Pseudooceanicola sp.]MDF1854897.1 endolytic transglycosylase MltG [Pseudooceanicola sp.]
MWRAVASNAFTLLIVAAFLLGGVILWGKNEYSSDGPLAQAICLRVPGGSNMARISRDLEESGAISSGPLFRIGADYAGKSDDLKAGSFLIPSGASMEEIVDIVTRGGASTCGIEVVYRIGVTRSVIEVRELDPATNRFVETAEFSPADGEVPEEYSKVRQAADTRYRIALAEGVTSWQVVDALSRFDVLSGEVKEIPAEGMLAPDSYEVRNGAARAALLAQMGEAQAALLAAAWESRAEDLPISTMEEALTLASIIEKETGVAEERGLVASVFVNRLRRGMKLQTDPTVIYGITGGKEVLGRGLRQSELRRETPYNTYVITGLPPTPIANPGRASLEAAVNPPDSDYLFFVADGTGGHAFAATLEEHNRNVANWRKIEAERSKQ